MTKVIDNKIQQQLEEARSNYNFSKSTEPRILHVDFNEEADLLVIILINGISVTIPRHLLQGLRDADPQDVKQVEITPSREGLHWETLNVDFSVPALLQGVFGTKIWMNTIKKEISKQGGQSKSDAKVAAARENGKKGGRPKSKKL